MAVSRLDGYAEKFRTMRVFAHGPFPFARFRAVVLRFIPDMASAFTQTYQMMGTACGRTSASLLLGNGVLAATWKFWEFSVSRFQTIFLLCAGLALFCVTLFFCLPSVVPKHEDYYNP